MHLLFGFLTGFIAGRSYRNLKNDNYEIGIILGVVALLCALVTGYYCAI